MTTIAQSAKGKAIFVDGPSANCMKRALGIELLNCKGLYQLLCGLGEYRMLACTPLITINPRRAVFANGLGKQLSEAGFQPLQVASNEGADDDALKDKIESLDPCRVGEIVIMTSDKDFVPVLRTKLTQGIQIIWVSTLCTDQGKSRPSVAQEVLELCNKGVFTFVELQKHVRMISLQRQLGSRVSNPGRDDVTIVTIRLQSKTPNDHRQLIDELARMKEKSSGFTFTIEE